MNGVILGVLGIWRCLVALDGILIEYGFQLFVDAGYDSWSKRGKGFLVLYVVGFAIISFMIPVVIDEHDSLDEIWKTFLMLLFSVLAIRFVILQVIRYGVSIFYDGSTKGDDEEMAKLILFALLKTILVIGIYCALAFDIGDIFLTVSMSLFLCAVFFEGCKSPQRKMRMSQKNRLHVQ